MAVDKFITRGATGLRRIAALVVSTGVSDGGRIVATDPATGQLDPSVVPDTGGSATPVKLDAAEVFSIGDNDGAVFGWTLVYQAGSMLELGEGSMAVFL